MTFLERALHAALTDPAFQASARDARRPLHIATGEETRRAIATSSREADQIAALLEEALDKVRS